MLLLNYAIFFKCKYICISISLACSAAYWMDNMDITIYMDIMKIQGITYISPYNIQVHIVHILHI